MHGGIIGIPSSTVAVSKGKDGTRSTSLSDVAPALLNNTRRDPNGTDFTGQCALKNYPAEFLSDSGKLSRSIVLMTDGGICVGGRFYTPVKK